MARPPVELRAEATGAQLLLAGTGAAAGRRRDPAAPGAPQAAREAAPPGVVLGSHGSDSKHKVSGRPTKKRRTTAAGLCCHTLLTFVLILNPESVQGLLHKHMAPVLHSASYL